MAQWNKGFYRYASLLGEMLALYKQGKSCREIAEDLDMPKTSVWLMLRRAGIREWVRSGKRTRPNCMDCSKRRPVSGYRCEWCKRLRVAEKSRLSKRRRMRERREATEEEFREAAKHVLEQRANLMRNLAER